MIIGHVPNPVCHKPPSPAGFLSPLTDPCPPITITSDYFGFHFVSYFSRPVLLQDLGGEGGGGGGGGGSLLDMTRLVRKKGPFFLNENPA